MQQERGQVQGQGQAPQLRQSRQVGDQLARVKEMNHFGDRLQREAVQDEARLVRKVQHRLLLPRLRGLVLPEDGVEEAGVRGEDEAVRRDNAGADHEVHIRELFPHEDIKWKHVIEHTSSELHSDPRNINPTASIEVHRVERSKKL